MKVIGMPDNEPYNYEFIVVVPSANKKLIFHSNHETEKAFEIAKEVGGEVIHNVRIVKKELKKEVADFIKEELNLYSDNIFSTLSLQHKNIDVLAEIYKTNFCEMIDTLIKEVKSFKNVNEYEN